MKRLACFLILSLLPISGYAASQETPPVSEIKDSVKVKLVDGIIKSKESLDMTLGFINMTVHENIDHNLSVLLSNQNDMQYQIEAVLVDLSSNYCILYY